MNPCKSHITALRKVTQKLDWGVTMNQSMMHLNDENKEITEQASEKIAEAIRILKTMEE